MTLYVDKFELDNQEILIKDTNAHNEIENINSDYVLMIGDSYADGWNGTTTVTGWCDAFNDIMGLTDNVNSFQEHEGACGFVAVGQQGHNFNGLLTQAYNNMTKEQTLKIKNIYVCGGTNDYSYTKTQINTAIYEFVQNAKSKFTNAKIHIGFFAYTQYNNKWDLLKVLNCYSNAGLYGASFINNSQYLIHNKNWLMSDDVHLSVDGYRQLANGLVSYHLGRNVNSNANYTLSFSTITGEIVQGTSNIFISDNMTQIFMDAIQFRFGNNPVTLNWSSYTKIGDFITDARLPLQNTMTFSSAALVNIGGTWYNTAVSIRITQGGIYAKMGGLPSGLNAEVTQLNLYSNSIYTISTIF